MGNDQDQLATLKCRDGLHHAAFSGDIERTGGFVHYQHGAVVI